MPLRVGRVLRLSLRVWARHLLPFAALQAILLSPLVVLDELGPSSPLLRWVLVVILGSLASAALTHAVIEDLAGRRVALAAGLRVAWARLAALLGLALVLAAVFAVAFFVCFAFARVLGGQLARVAPDLADAGALVALFVPLAGLFARFYVAAPAVVVEDAGALESVRRSLLLSRGQSGRVFGVLVILLAALLGLAVLVPAGWPARGYGVAAASLLATACAVTYAELRALQEGLPADALAAVFD